MAHSTHILLPEDGRPVATLADYRARGGIKGLEKALSLSPKDVIAELRTAGLRGRGGAGFPTAIKWTTVYEDPCSVKYVVCNGSEGEPGTYKDRFLLQKNPFQLVEGLLIARHVINAKKIIIGLKAKFTREMARLEGAIAEMTAANILKADDIEIVPGPDEYLFGEEKALLEVIDGRPAMPRIMPPFMQGARYTPMEYNPTIVNNVETMSHVAHILANGGDWFRGIGCDDTPGTTIFTLVGDVKKPGMYELPLGTTLNQLLHDIGGGPVGSQPFKAVFSGVANKVMTPKIFDVPMGFGTLREAGGGLGSAGMIVYDESMCMVKVARCFSQFLAEESCGQCVPCKMGTGIITKHLAKFEDGIGSLDDIDIIRAETGKVTNQTRCFLPTEEAILIRSILDTFPVEFQSHIESGCCPYSREPQLPLINNFDEATGQFTFAPPKAGVYMWQ